MCASVRAGQRACVRDFTVSEIAADAADIRCARSLVVCKLVRTLRGLGETGVRARRRTRRKTGAVQAHKPLAGRAQAWAQN